MTQEIIVYIILASLGGIWLFRIIKSLVFKAMPRVAASAQSTAGATGAAPCQACGLKSSCKSGSCS